MTLYVWPKLGRAGLGNCLLPWARAEIFAERTSARMLAPDWATPRIGPYFRGEAEKRRYGSFFHCSDHVRGIAKLLVRLSARRYRENTFEETRREATRSTLVVFEGVGALFAPLRGHRLRIRERLWQMTKPALLPTQRAGRPFIAMHVRRGDLTKQGLAARDLPEVAQYTPISWFTDMARLIRHTDATCTFPIVVFTDGDAEEVAELLALPGAERAPRRAAITDLWALSQASLLFGSGHSTFSMWASYLGGMPTFYAPGKLSQRVLDDGEDLVEQELGADGALPQRALDLAMRR